MLHAPVWATWLIALVPILLVLGIALAIWGDDEPGNGTVHTQEDEPREDPDGDREDEPPEPGSADDPGEMVIAA